MTKKLTIGVDIGGTKMVAGLVSEQGEILERKKVPTPLDSDPQMIFDQLVELLKELTASKSFNPKLLDGIGLGVPGIVDKDQKTILATPNIRLAHFPLVEKLRRQYSVDVIAGNDVNLGLLGEKWWGCGQKASDLVGLFPGTGVGGAIIIDGKLMIGVNGAAGELGHMIMDPNGPLCSCGNKGCLEALAGRWAIERDIREAVAKGKKTVITQMTEGNLDRIKSKMLKEALKKNDELVVHIMTNVAETLGKACISLNHIFNPQMIVFGGGVTEACGWFMLPIITKHVKDDPFFKNFNKCAIVESQLGDDAVMLGAVALVKHK